MSETHDVKLTVVVATFNCADTLQACFDSIAEQTYPNIELIIVDGASTDATLDVIQANHSIITHWITEPDRGIYDAWNKAIAIATGEWFYFIGADDKLWDSYSIACAIERICELPIETVIAYGCVQLTRMNGAARIVGEDWNRIRKRMYGLMCIPHQGVFHSRRVFEKFGAFDKSLEIAGDYKLILLSLSLATPVFLDDTIVAVQYAGGKSALRSNRVMALKEFRQVQADLGVPVSIPWVWAYAKGLVLWFVSRFFDIKA